MKKNWQIFFSLLFLLISKIAKAQNIDLMQETASPADFLAANFIYFIIIFVIFLIILYLGQRYIRKVIPFEEWTNASRHKIKLSFFDLYNWYGEGVDVKAAIKLMIKAKEGGISLSVKDVSSLVLDLAAEQRKQLVESLVKAKKAKLEVIDKLEQIENAEENTKNVQKTKKVDDKIIPPKDTDKDQEDAKDKNDELFEEPLARGTVSYQVSLHNLIGFTLHGGDPDQYVSALIEAKNFELKGISKELLENCYDSNIDMVEFVIGIARAKLVGVDLDLNQLATSKIGKDPKFITQVINILIKANKAGLLLTEKELKLKEKGQHLKSGLKISQEDTLEIHHSGQDMEAFLNVLIKAQHAGLKLTIQELLDHAMLKGDVNVFVDCLIKSEKAGISLTKTDLEEYFYAHADIKKIVSAFIKAKQAKVEIDKDKLFKYFLAGGDVGRLLDAIKIGRDALQIENVEEKLINHFLVGGDPLDVVIAMNNAKTLGAQLGFDFAAAVDRIDFDRKHMVVQMVMDSVNPQVIVPEHPVRCIAKDGMELFMLPKITVKTKISRIFNGSKKETLLSRVSQALIAETGKYQDYHDVYHHLDEISKHITETLQHEEEFNSMSYFEIISIFVSDIQMGQDPLTHHKIEHSKIKAETMKIEAEAKLKDAEANVEQAFADAIRSGTVNVNEYLKKQIYKEKKDNVDESNPTQEEHQKTPPPHH